MATVEAINPDLQQEESVDLVANAFKYFYRTNFINKNILSQGKVLKKHLEDQWENIPTDRRDALLDLLFVDEEVREKYGSYRHSTTAEKRQSNTKDHDVDKFEESFPRLLINSGQKINVDFENELWTWRDEHSGPFSWMSRSQQDLTLDDLEPDNILKPQPKQLRVDLEDESSVKKAQAQFTHPCNSWCQDILQDFKKHQAEITVSPSPSMDFAAGVKTSVSAEEVNPAFEDSVDDLSARSSPEKDNGHDSSPEKEESSNKKSKKRDQGRKSPSPKKSIIHSGSFKKSPVKKSERGKEEKLIRKGEESFVAEAYCNPAMDSEWSNFVGDQLNMPVTDAPEAQVIDRGGGTAADVNAAPSPYRGDRVQLISDADDSPAQPRTTASSGLALTPDYSDWSAESTPDHKTHLLKGVQSPTHYSYKMNASSPPQIHSECSDFTAGVEGSQRAEEIDAATSSHQADDELLTVVMDGRDIHVTSQEAEKRDSKIPSTGFDFLDNW